MMQGRFEFQFHTSSSNDWSIQFWINLFIDLWGMFWTLFDCIKNSASKLSYSKIWQCKTQEEHQHTYNDSASGLHCRKNPTLLTFSWLEYLGIHMIRLQQNRQIRQQPTICHDRGFHYFWGTVTLKRKKITGCTNIMMRLRNNMTNVHVDTKCRM